MRRAAAGEREWRKSMSEPGNTGRHTIENQKVREITKELPQDRKNRRWKSYLAAGVIALAAVAAIAGIARKNSLKQKEMEQETAIMAENEWKEDAAEDPVQNNAADQEALDDAIWEAQDSIGRNTSPDDVPDTAVSLVQTEEENQAVTEPIIGETAPLSFAETGKLSWPLHGDVILNFSMDKSVYFATLDQYKYNPALVIKSDVNTKVNAAASGEILHIETGEETGATVTVDIGDGYQLIYGQLKEIQCEEGDFIREGELLGFVGEPTKYYSVEGSNLFFEMQKDGKPVNPLDYLES